MHAAKKKKKRNRIFREKYLLTILVYLKLALKPCSLSADLATNLY
jgi:hypothetical protein